MQICNQYENPITKKLLDNGDLSAGSGHETCLNPRQTENTEKNPQGF
jgi:hypothetical protein